ncbi:HAD family hydrolase [Alteribacillus sp. HJP-4]|uniref:HAD family hydrolase n=1 Tax=Alteribacillus sp. HJP-4 TaxID=2775394 RepID=UPI0035CCCBE8
MEILKAIIFDFDGTLANTLPVNIYSFQQVFKKFDNKSLSNNEVVDLFGPPEPEIITEQLNNTQLEEAIEHYFKVYEDHHNRLVDKNHEIEKMLAVIKQKDIKLGVVTGKSRRSLNISLEKLDLKEQFDVIVTGDEVDDDKPNPEGVLKALSELNVTNEEAMYIGDSDGDIHAGKRAGLAVAGVQWLPEYQSSEYTTEPDAVFTRPDELFGFLK